MKKTFKIEPNHKQLYSLTKVISFYTNIDVDRAFSRRKNILYIWYDEKFDIIHDFLNNHIYKKKNLLFF